MRSCFTSTTFIIFILSILTSALPGLLETDEAPRKPHRFSVTEPRGGGENKRVFSHPALVRTCRKRLGSPGCYPCGPPLVGAFRGFLPEVSFCCRGDRFLPSKTAELATTYFQPEDVCCFRHLHRGRLEATGKLKNRRTRQVSSGIKFTQTGGNFR